MKSFQSPCGETPVIRLISMLALCVIAAAFQCSAQVTNIDEFCDQFQTEKSKFCISVKATGGQFVVDDTRLRLNQALRDNYRPLLSDTKNIAELQGFLSGKINELLALNGNAICKLLKPRDPNFCKQDGTWPQIKVNFVNAPFFRTKLTNVFRDKINQNSPLSFIRRDIEPVDSNLGMVEFEVDDPIGDICDSTKYEIEFRPDPSTAISNQPEICRMLRGLSNKFWDKKFITEIVTNFYARKGLIPAVNFTDVDEKRVLTIRESPILDRVFVMVDKDKSSEKDRLEMMKIFYSILPHGQWKTFASSIKSSVQNPDDHPLEVDDLGQRFYLYPDQQYFNLFDYQTQQLRLAGIGYDLTFIECNIDDTEVERVCLEVRRIKKDDDDKKPVDEQERAVPIANSEGVIDTNIVKPEGQNKPVPKSNVLKKRVKPAADDSGEDAVDSEDASGTLFIGGGFNYQVGDKPRFFARVQRRSFSGDDFSFQIGGEKEVLGNVSYFKDYLFFGVLERRLSIQLTGKSDFNGTRRFDGVETDERRSGGLIRAELDLVNNWRRGLVRLHVEGQSVTVQLSRNDSVIAKEPLSTLDLGLAYYVQANPIRKYPQWGRIESRIRFGLGLGSDEPTFTAFSLKGKYHRQTIAGLELDVAGLLELRSNGTPLYELATFGGAEIIRGFRPDELLGRRVWTIQPEIWFPVPGVGSSKNPIGQMLRENIRLAGFVDVGGVYGTGNQFSGTKAGPGLGVRFIRNPVVLKFDWAYGVGSVPTLSRHGRFYFGIETNLPF